jgi:hypothetical protein
MDKPTKKVVKNPMLNYSDIIDFIEEKYNIKTRDYAGLFGSKDKESHFNQYQRITEDKMPFGNGIYPDSSGKNKQEWVEDGYEGWTVFRNGQRIKATKEEYDDDYKLIHEQFQRYTEWSKTNPEPPYLDYWHWLLGKCFSDITNDSSAYFNVKEILEDDETPKWVKEITQLIYDEFKDELDSEGGTEVWISW